MGTDRELLELAAKAAGIKPASYDGHEVGWYNTETGSVGQWNPLKDDGDALRLATKLRIDIRFDDEAFPDQVIAVGVLPPPDGAAVAHTELLGDDIGAAVRRAITRIAARLGRAMA